MRGQFAICAAFVIMLALMAAPIASAQTAYTLKLGETLEYNDRNYTLRSVSSTPNCVIFFDGVAITYERGDTVGDFVLTEIHELEGSSYVILEGEEEEEEEEEEDDEPFPDPIAELRYTLESGDILLFSDDSAVNGAMAYVFGETMNPTFLFWSGGRLPTISKTPTPDEKVSLSPWQTYESQTIWGLIVRVEAVDLDRVVVVLETDDSISLMKTTAGGSDWTDVVEQLKLYVQGQVPVAQPPADNTWLAVISTGFLVLAVIVVILWYRSTWGPK